MWQTSSQEIKYDQPRMSPLPPPSHYPPTRVISLWFLTSQVLLSVWHAKRKRAAVVCVSHLCQHPIRDAHPWRVVVPHCHCCWVSRYVNVPSPVFLLLMGMWVICTLGLLCCYYDQARSCPLVIIQDTSESFKSWLKLDQGSRESWCVVVKIVISEPNWCNVSPECAIC